MPGSSRWLSSSLGHASACLPARISLSASSNKASAATFCAEDDCCCACAKPELEATASAVASQRMRELGASMGATLEPQPARQPAEMRARLTTPFNVALLASAEVR